MATAQGLEVLMLVTNLVRSSKGEGPEMVSSGINRTELEYKETGSRCYELGVDEQGVEVLTSGTNSV